MQGWDIPLWVILLIIVALIALIALVLAKVMAAAQSAVTGSGGGSAPPQPAPYQKTLEELQALLKKIKDEDRSPTKEECEELNKLCERAKTEGAPASLTDPLQAGIGQICPR